MRRVKDDPRYGLASVDAEGRPAVVTMQLYSAPGGTGASPEALARSLEEVGTWDFAGADVLIEHSDALVPGRTAAKGYLSLADELTDELTAVDAVRSDLVGVSGNWGRPVIEGHTVERRARPARGGRRNRPGARTLCRFPPGPRRDRRHPRGRQRPVPRRDQGGRPPGGRRSRLGGARAGPAPIRHGGSL